MDAKAVVLYADRSIISVSAPHNDAQVTKIKGAGVAFQQTPHSLTFVPNVSPL